MPEHTKDANPVYEIEQKHKVDKVGHTVFVPQNTNIYF